MKKLFIYYSLTGNGDKVAKRLENIGYDIVKLEVKKPLPKKFFFRVLVGGFKAGLNMKDKLLNTNISLDGYDEIVIGSPIWNGKLSCPINKLLSLYNFAQIKNLSFILYSGSGEAPKAIKKINKLYKAQVTVLKEPEKYNDELDKIKL